MVSRILTLTLYSDPGTVSSRQADAELGAARAGFDLDRATVADDDGLRRRKPEAGALADRLRRIELVENLVAIGRRDSRAVVDDPDDNRDAFVPGRHPDVP